MRLSKRRSLREENRLWNHPGHRSSPSPVSFQLCDLDKQLPFSEVQHFFIEVKLTQHKTNPFAASLPVVFGSFTGLSNRHSVYFQQSPHPPPHPIPNPPSVLANHQAAFRLWGFTFLDVS